MGKTTPAVSVIIPTYNRSEYLAECLESILGQTLPPAQVIVVNDASTDGTGEVLKPYLGEIQYVESEIQRGRAGALNVGLARATGEYVWTFDDDDVALPDALERFVAPLELHPEHGYSFSRFYYSESRNGDNRIGRILFETKIPDLDARGPLIPLLEANYLCGAALFARTRCYREVGGFDSSLLRSQDYELGIRIARRFSGIEVEGPPTFHYRQHGGLRGPARDRFGSEKIRGKWLRYDQVTFDRLWEELPLQDYLPPGTPLESSLREAHLQRMAIMASKLLFGRVLLDLQELATLGSSTPLSPRERAILSSMLMRDPYYREGGLLDQPAFFRELQRLSGSSNAISVIRKQIRDLLLPLIFSVKGGGRRRAAMRLTQLYRPTAVP